MYLWRGLRYCVLCPLPRLPRVGSPEDVCTKPWTHFLLDDDDLSRSPIGQATQGNVSLFYRPGPLFTNAMYFVVLSQRWGLHTLCKVHVWASCSSTHFSPGSANTVGGETPGRNLLEARDSSCWRSWATYKADNVLQLAELMERSTGTQTHLFFILWMKSIFWITWAVWSRGREQWFWKQKQSSYLLIRERMPQDIIICDLWGA